jgi:hypothetical protein
MDAIVAVRRSSCRNLVMMRDRENKMRMIASEHWHVRLISESPSNFAYGAVTVSRTDAGNRR